MRHQSSARVTPALNPLPIEDESNEAVFAVAPPAHRKGRGAVGETAVRFEAWSREAVDDGWRDSEHAAHDSEQPALGARPAAGPAATPAAAPLVTRVEPQLAKTIISRNDSPDLSFSQSVNPYYGCEHGCVYCYARPSYAYWGLSPGLDFETRLFAKTNAAELLRRELSAKNYRPSAIVIGANTDCYQPAERELKITRSILEVCAEFNQPVGIVTKSSLVERDIDLLAPMSARGMAMVFVSVASLEGPLARILEPRAAAPYRRIEVIRNLSAAGVVTGIMTAPVIPMINDSGLEKSLEAAREAGASEAGYVLLRLARELSPMFRSWLEVHFPERAAHVMSLIQASRGGRDYQSDFATRMKGEGVFAQMIAQRFAKTCTRLGLHTRRQASNVSHFTVPAASLSVRKPKAQADSAQGSLF
jgi:DNA repair photolyase